MKKKYERSNNRNRKTNNHKPYLKKEIERKKAAKKNIEGRKEEQKRQNREEEKRKYKKANTERRVTIDKSSSINEKRIPAIPIKKNFRNDDPNHKEHQRIRNKIIYLAKSPW